MAAPKSSATSVAAQAKKMVAPRKFDSQRGKCARMLAAKDRPVISPSRADIFCKRMSIRVLKEMTQRRLYWKSAPPAILVAQLPGSIKPTVTRKPGPRYLRNSRLKNCRQLGRRSLSGITMEGGSSSFSWGGKFASGEFNARFPLYYLFMRDR